MKSHYLLTQRGSLIAARFFIWLLTGSLLFIGSAQAQYIVTNGADNGAGTLRVAITAGNASGTAYTISLQTSGPISLTASLPDITQSCTITGATSLTPATATGGSIIQRSSENGVPEFRIFKAATSGKNFTLTDIILENGVGNEGDNNRGGGGLLTDNGVVLTMLRCLVRNCIFPVNRQGGGVHVVNGMGSFIDCEFQNNGNSNATGTKGGGVRIGSEASQNQGNVTFSRCTFTGNSAERGGGVYNAGPVVFTNCTFDANNGFGSQVYGYNGNVDIIGCTSQNGGFFSFSSLFQIINSLFINSAFTGGNTASLGGNVTNSNSGNVFNQSSDKNNQTIVLSTLQQNPGGLIRTFAIDASSPAVNAGLGSTAQPGITLPTTDANNQPRQCNPDAGAFEVQTGLIAITQQPASSSVVAPGANVSVPVGTSGSVTSYQWYKNGGSVSGQTSATLTLNGVTSAQAGSYSLVATSACNSLTTNAFSLSVLSPAMISGTKTVSGSFVPGGSITYSIVLTNNGQTTQADNPGNELTDVLPSGLTLSTASATTGTAIATPGTNTVTWNGSLPAPGSVTITLTAIVNNGTNGQGISNQANISYDGDANGTNESSAQTDDPAVSGTANPTTFVVTCPALSVSLTNDGPLTCAKTSVILTASGGSTYTFSPNASQPGGPSSNTAMVSQTGVYSVTATAQSGCTGVSSTTVTSNTALSAPTLQASALSTTNQPISVTASGCSGGTINWLPQGGTGQANGSVYTFSQPGNYTLSATCTVGSCTSPAASPLIVQIRPGGFAITAVTMVNCQLVNAASGQYQVSFTPQYSGANSNPISFSVVNEKSPTTDPAPYSLRLYSDNPAITLVANQSGNAEARYRFEWLASCQAGTSPNQPPTTSGIPNQTLLQNQPYQLQLTNYFSDPDGQQLTFTQSGLPAGLSLTGSVISGAPSATGVSSINITALDPGGLSVNTSFQLTVNTVPTTPTGFTIVGVSTVSCEVLSAGQRRLTFNPQYGGASSAPISFSVVNEKLPTTDPGPYSLTLYTDNPAVTLSAQQGGSVATYRYNWLAVCNTNSRLGVAEAGSGLQVKVLGNPVEGRVAEIEISGVAGQAVQLHLVDLQGKLLHQQRISEASSTERVSVPVSGGKGLLLLQVSTASERQQVKLLKN